MLTIGQAAKASGRSKATIWRDLKSGKLSATRNPNKTMAIDPAELARVYPNAPNGSDTSRLKPEETPSETALKRENALLRETVDDLRHRLDASEEERRRLTLMLLPAPKPDRWWLRVIRPR